MHMMIAAENTPSRDLSAPVDLLADVLMDLLFNGGQGYLHSPQLQRCAAPDFVLQLFSLDAAAQDLLRREPSRQVVTPLGWVTGRQLSRLQQSLTAYAAAPAPASALELMDCAEAALAGREA